jgi:hypothetical protein
MEALRSSETSVFTGATRRNIPEYGIPHSHRREYLKSYKLKVQSSYKGRGSNPDASEFNFTDLIKPAAPCARNLLRR